MGGIFGVVSKNDCVFDLFFGTDYHSHLGTRRGGMAVYGANGFKRAIHNIENSPFRTKFEKDVDEMQGNIGIGCISDNEPQPLIVRSHLGSYAITTVGKVNNIDDIIDTVNIRLLGLIPEDEKTAVRANKGELCIDVKKARSQATAIRNIAKRITGVETPLYRFWK